MRILSTAVVLMAAIAIFFIALFACGVLIKIMGGWAILVIVPVVFAAIYELVPWHKF